MLVFRPFAQSLSGLCLTGLMSAFFAPVTFGQTTGPILLPYTISTIAGGGAASTAGGACSAGNALKATDALGDGCLASQALFSSDIRGGVTTDPLGNIYIADTSSSQIRRIDPRSGLITTYAGGNKICTGTAVDKNGDGCVATTNTVMNSPRGIGNDPYGNVFIAGYGDNLVHLVCNAVSPLCTAAQVGTMRVAAGCYTTTAAYGTSGNTGDGQTAAGPCGSGVATVNQTRGVNADRFGNIYIGDTGNFRFRVVVGPVIPGATNPLIAMLQMDPAYSSITAASAAGKIYPLVGGSQFTVPASGAACSPGSSSNSIDSYGDGCPFYNTSITTSGGFVQGVATDAFGDFIFTDSQSVGRVRVIFAGGVSNPMAHVITVNNPTVVSPQAGYAYSIAGGGSTTTSTTPILASSATLDGSLFRVNTDAYGNIFVGDNTLILFLDINTGSLRRIAANSTVCTGADTAGDGCPATQASFGGSTSVLGLALDNLGNLFFADGTNHTVRKISASSFAPATFGTGSAPGIFIHGIAGTTLLSTTLAPGSDFTLGAQTCTTNVFDATYDCIVPVNFAPTQIGLRDGPINIQSTPAGTAFNGSLTSTSLGPNLTFDPTSPASPATQTLAGTIIPATVAVDGHGNAYTVDTASKFVTRVRGGSSTAISSSLGALPNQLAVDPQGNVYVATSGSGAISKLTFTAPSTYTTTSITNSSIVSAAAIAVDANDNLYIADNTSGAVYKLSQTTGIATTLTASALSNPVSLALDNVGNLLIADSGNKAVYRLPTTGIATGLPPTVTLPSGTTPVAVAADAAGNVYVADSAAGSIYAIPFTGATSTVVTGYSSITGIAVDGLGNVYATVGATSGITEILRNQYSFSFGSSITATLSGSIGNAGNSAAQGYGQSDTVDFQLSGTGSTCNFAATSVLPGAACIAVATFNPSGTGTGPVTDSLTFLPAASSTGSLSLTAVKTGTVTTTTTAITGESPAAPIYVAGGAPVSFTVIVSASKGTAAGFITVALDGGTPVTYNLDTTGTAIVPLTGLAAGTHTIAAVYPTQSGVSGSTAVPVVFTVARAATSVTFVPATLTQPFSQAIGTAVFNATSNGVPGAFVYTATPTAGAPIAVDSSSYLAIGTYSLAVAFTPSDTTDYLPSSATVAVYTVTKANTVAAVGASTNVVAGDGSGNFTSVAAAIAALPNTGGTIYIRPGTYSGQFNVSYPNVSLRGLGGIAQNVLITAENGAFSAPYPTGVTAASNGFQGDQGSATVVVDKQTIGGTSYTPKNFYMENLSIQNTYDTDATNSNTLAVVSGNCTAGQPANNNLALYNAGTICASQALALWIRADKAVLNNVRLISLQDTLFAGSQGCGTTCVPSRQYYWKGYITGDVDYIFGDAAAVFDGTTFFTTYHGVTATGTETIEAQNKSQKTGSSTDYLSGYILNNAILTSQSAGMTQLYFGRPYGQYSTFILLNTSVDQVNPLGWIEFSGDSNLPTSTYAEFNTQGAGGTAASLAGRETTSLRPEVLIAARAAQYAPVTFLATPAPDVWNPATALAAGVNAFVPTGSTVAITVGKSITILAHPQTPGGGAIPTGTYILTDGGTTLASGTLDPSGSVYLTTSTLSAGVHNITFTYSGDTNFNTSTTTTPLTITVGGTQSTLSLLTTSPIYGAAANVTVAVTQSDTTHPLTGSVALTVDSGSAKNATVTAGAVSFSLSSLSAGTHTLVANYSGDAFNGASSATGSITVAQASLTVTAPTIAIAFGSAVPAYTSAYSGFVNGDTPASLSGAPLLTTTPTLPTAVGVYPITASAGTLVAPNYSLTFVNGLLTIGRAATTTSLATSNTSPGTGASVTFVATVTSPAQGVPTGVVSFLNGTSLLDNITLSSSGTATFTTSFKTVGTSVIMAVYSGDASFSGSTSTSATVTTVSPTLTITANPAALTIAAGSSGSTTLSFTPTGNYQGTASLTCAGLPANSSCSLTPSLITFSGNNAVQTGVLTIRTNVPVGRLELSTPGSRPGTTLAGIFLLPGFFLVGVFAARRKALRGVGSQLLLLLLTFGCIAGAIGCGSSQPISPAGTSTVILLINTTGPGGPTSQPFALSVTITQ
jgi:pectin methylesterase-like acyl-CoA thioesterase/sugar lactone lactonase YvrE